ncbi:MAG: hypothetical protein [Cotesia congregata filamentous virus 2]
MSICYYCSKDTNPKNNHIYIKNMTKNKIYRLLQMKDFWCECGYCIFDHYPADECFCGQ